MPEDDGSQVYIKSETVLRYSDGTFAHVIEVCNKTDTEKDTWVSSWPYGEKTAKQGAKKGKRLHLDPNECKRISFPLREKPIQFYTDVYEYGNSCCEEGDRYHYTVTVIGESGFVDVQLPEPIERHYPRRISTRHCHMPYPRSLEESGRSRVFRVERFRGLPPGWQVSHSSPAIGKSVRLNPHEKEYPFSIQFHAKNPPPEGVSVITVDISIDGKPVKPPYSVPIEFKIIRKTTLPLLHGITAYREKPKPRIGIIAYTSDELGLLSEPMIHYSINDGHSWIRQPMDPFHLGRMGVHGLIGGLFRTVIPVASHKSTVLVSVTAQDQLGNKNSSPVYSYPTNQFEGSSIKELKNLNEFERAIAEQVLISVTSSKRNTRDENDYEFNPTTTSEIKEDIPKKYHKVFDAIASIGEWPKINN